MNHRIALASLVFAASCGSAPKGPRVSGGRVGAACAKIAAETRVKLVAVGAGSLGAPNVDVLVEWLGPYGACVDPKSATGTWAFVLDGTLALEATPVESYSGEDGGEDGEEATEDLSPTELRTRARAVFVTADGRDIETPSQLELPMVQVLIGTDGEEYFPPWPYASSTVTADSRDLTGDGVPELFVAGTREIHVLAFDGTAVTPYAPSKVLPFITEVLDIDKDGRSDLGDGASLELDLVGDGNHAEPMVFVAHATPDGRWVTDDAAVRAHYQALCAGLGRSPWVLGRDQDALLANIACARLHGVPAATIVRGVDAEIAAQPASFLEDGTAPDVIVNQLDDVRALIGRDIPVTLGRTDGRVVIDVTKVTASSNEADWQGYRFVPDHVVDGDLGTSWQPRKKGASPWVALHFGAPKTVTAIEIANGFQRTDLLGDLFEMNRRATSVRVNAGKTQIDLALDPAARGYQTLVLPAPVTSDQIKVTVMATADGSRWPNVALSEVRALGAP